MCLIIDTCCLATVFDRKSKNHSSFAPVLAWINGSGYMIYGGTKYNKELRKATKYLPYVAELSRRGRIIRIPNQTVDSIAIELKRKMPEADFNDEHLVALVIAARCCVVCTVDDVAISYLKRSELFRSAGLDRPKIYKGDRRHRDLCCRSHLTGICRSQK